MSDFNDKTEQNVYLYDRKKLSVTGIVSVDSFDESSISATTVNGEVIVVEGSGISVTDVNIEKGCFEAQGNFSGFFYTAGQTMNPGVLSRLFGKR